MKQTGVVGGVRPGVLCCRYEKRITTSDVQYDAFSRRQTTFDAFYGYDRPKREDGGLSTSAGGAIVRRRRPSVSHNTHPRLRVPADPEQSGPRSFA